MILKKGSLVDKLTIYISMTILTIVIILSTIITVWLNNYLFNVTRNKFETETSIISEKVKGYVSLSEDSNLQDLQRTIDLVGKITDSKILIGDNLGYVYEVSSEDDSDKKYSSIGLSEENMKKLKNGECIEIKDGSFKEANYTYLAPVIDNGYFAGIISMSISIKYIMNFSMDIWKVVVLFVVILMILIIVINGVIVKKFVTTPIRDINITTQRFAKGEFEGKIEIKSNDEIGELGSSFNLMALSLAEVDRNRKAFISNVSHELRSPITSIKGFISGIIDGIIPKDKENYYLNIVYDEINRLSRLVDDLLDISALEDNKIKLNKVEIDINTLIEICLVKLENRIIEKDLHVEMIVEKKHQFVYADRDKIIQVLTNLLDNAIKYGDKSGCIKIEIKEKGPKIYISISNKGKLLSEEEKLKIWERFYKADKSRTNKESTGLGLSIVRLILTRHGEDIWVENKDEGVMFTFTLTKQS